MRFLDMALLAVMLIEARVLVYLGQSQPTNPGFSAP